MYIYVYGVYIRCLYTYTVYMYGVYIRIRCIYIRCLYTVLANPHIKVWLWPALSTFYSAHLTTIQSTTHSNPLDNLQPTRQQYNLLSPLDNNTIYNPLDINTIYNPLDNNTIYSAHLTTIQSTTHLNPLDNLQPT